jgi:hypothetical protein
MPDTPSTTSHVDASPEESGARTSWWKWPRLKAITPLVIALVAVAVAIAGWFRPAHDAKPSFTEQQTAQAKADVCLAYATVHQGVVVNTHLADPVPNDRIGHLAVAANARLALLGGGAYLHDRVDAEPATPTDIAQAVNSVGSTIEQLGAAYLANANNDVLNPLRHELDSEIASVTKLCG